MTDLLPIEPDSLPSETDPVAYMVTVLNRAKGWLQEAVSIESVREAKAIAVGYEAVIREKELAMDAELAATEIVRRCERRIGQLVREGQDRGTVLRRGEAITRGHPAREGDVRRPSEVIGVSPNDHGAIGATYAFGDASEEQFESALSEARGEGNLSRANVVRKVKGDAPSPPDRSEWHRGTRRIDAPRVLRETSFALDGLASGLETIAGQPLNDEGRQWLTAASESLQQVARRLNALRRKGGVQ